MKSRWKPRLTIFLTRLAYKVWNSKFGDFVRMSTNVPNLTSAMIWSRLFRLKFRTHCSRFCRFIKTTFDLEVSAWRNISAYIWQIMKKAKCRKTNKWLRFSEHKWLKCACKNVFLSVDSQSGSIPGTVVLSCNIHGKKQNHKVWI